MSPRRTKEENKRFSEKDVEDDRTKSSPQNESSEQPRVELPVEILEIVDAFSTHKKVRRKKDA